MVRGVSSFFELQYARELQMLTSGAVNACLYPMYVGAEAYLDMQFAGPAAVEFQRILGHRGLLWNCPIRALAHLGLARAHVLQGDNTKVPTAHQDFLAL